MYIPLQYRYLEVVLMQIIARKRCIIGEGPIWNDFEKKLYYTHGRGNEICIYDIATGELNVRPVPFGCAAFCFDKNNKLIVSAASMGVFYLNDDNTTTPLYDVEKYNLMYSNDMKVGPDGAIYVGTLSKRKAGVGDDVDGKLWRIDKNGEVRMLLDELNTPNGMDWSMDEKRFYYVSGGGAPIKEYHFDKATGNIEYSGRCVEVPNADGMTIDNQDILYAACWGKGHIAVIDSHTMEVTDHIPVPAKAPSSCGFAGEDMNYLAVTSATFNVDIETDENAGFTFMKKMDICGRKPYLFG